MERIELEIVALSHSITQTHSYAVVLGELNGLRRLPIVIGGFEAQAIAVALEHMTPSRPLTHDLFANFMHTFNIELLEVEIYKLEEGIFYSKLICLSNNEQVEIDSRTSDALALAVRLNSRIYTTENILETAGLLMEQTDTEAERQPAATSASAPETKESKSTPDTDIKKMSLEELHTLLQEVLEHEDYVRAISIRDEINNRKGK
jgi:bifunctional DNase/RNase